MQRLKETPLATHTTTMELGLCILLFDKGSCHNIKLQNYYWFPKGKFRGFCHLYDSYISPHFTLYQNCLGNTFMENLGKLKILSNPKYTLLLADVFVDAILVVNDRKLNSGWLQQNGEVIILYNRKMLRKFDPGVSDPLSLYLLVPLTPGNPHFRFNMVTAWLSASLCLHLSCP